MPTSTARMPADSRGLNCCACFRRGHGVDFPEVKAPFSTEPTVETVAAQEVRPKALPRRVGPSVCTGIGSEFRTVVWRERRCRQVQRACQAECKE